MDWEMVTLVAKQALTFTIFIESCKPFSMSAFNYYFNYYY